MRTEVRGGQEAIFIANPATGQEQVAQGALPDAEKIDAVSIFDRDVELLGVLATFSELNSYGGFKKAVNSPQYGPEIAERYGKNTPIVASGVEKSRTLARREAKWGFARAAGMFHAIDVLPTHDDEGNEVDNRRKIQAIRSVMSKEFVLFQKSYDGPQNSKDREDYQRLLLRNLRGMQDQVTVENRQRGARPHRRNQPKAAKHPKVQPQVVPEKPTDRPLGTRERVRPLRDDVRFGAYPRTHREKNYALDMLDYLDNPKYQLGTTNRQLEIFNHSARIKMTGSKLPDGPERAAYSLTHELLDYFYDARESLILLRALDEAMTLKKNDETNPYNDLLNPHLAVGLTSMYEEHKDALVRVLQFIDIEKYARGDTSTTFLDPLLTREDRWAKEGAGKHKTVHDQYTQPKTEAQKKRIDEAVFALKIKQLRDSVGPAILDQTKRVLFFASRIQEIPEGLTQQTFRDTRDLALVALSNIELEFLPHAAA